MSIGHSFKGTRFPWFPAIKMSLWSKASKGMIFPSSYKARGEPAQLITPVLREVYDLHLYCGRNNTHAHCSKGGGAIVQASGGMFAKKANRGTTDAGYTVAALMCTKLKKLINPASVNYNLVIRGFGPGREQAFKAFRAADLSIIKISDVTGIRHGGNRPKKARRL